MIDANTVDAGILADLALWQMEDPLGYAVYAAHAAARAEFAALGRGADEDTKAKLNKVLEHRLSGLALPAAPKRFTVADLGASEGGKSKSAWQATQAVEPERDGLPWCTWEDAEHALVRASIEAGVKAGFYRLVRDEKAMTLTLHRGE